MVIEEAVEIHLPVQTSSLENFMKIQQLENNVKIMDQKITAIHELVERLVEVNLQLKKQQVPMYDSNAVGSGTSSGSTSNTSDEPKTIYLMKSSDKLRIKGKTFDIKDELKTRFGAQWETGMKMWCCSCEHEQDLTNFLNEKGFNVSK
jgi:hypothetical protein